MLDKGARLLFYMYMASLGCELSAVLRYYWPQLKNPCYHVYNLVELIIITMYFMYTVGVRKRLLLIVLCLIYLGVEIFNTIYFQPLSAVNTNVITFECFMVIPMALYSLYRILINDNISKIQNYVHFWFWTFFLVYFSSSFFFWQFIIYFYRHDKLFYTISIYGHIIVNLAVYTGVLLTYLRYPKMARNGA
ncbi:hypothetical protein GCM10023093_03360 [Nemorincola caseinilytica]|uniref:Uncharacterized protein n=2 Tax=Nemorincola caseinilytica TaxID=2054315 RepID=A0ABP8N395_9BACT